MATATEEKPAAKASKTLIEKAVKAAEELVAAQPKRAELKLKEEKDEAFALGKSIAADLWRLRNAKAGETSQRAVESMSKRIAENVAKRNKIRKPHAVKPAA